MRVFIGLGSNLESPLEQIKTAVNDMQLMLETEFIACSSLYKSPPMGPQDQPDYINAVIELDTELAPHLLLDQLQQIEQQHGRIRKRHWGERTLDLDLLVYGDVIIHDERLTVPHPGIATRAFVLYPLAELDEQLVIPGCGKVKQLVKLCPRDGLQQVEKIGL
ncbi:2-amino-4-hydroxy-6-hydroxymethyldihydropteridine diphosphokinase [Methylophaga sp. 42_25_T18]|nr:2-amino-4-hydroxy-6-hydroxymethyldihydropteridine diphosphokinase [Methylophaga sp. 42_25_T18]OUR88040.1 2-amino-4-hydroxy-6-hydroxymethyldihydropteridine diphosphokinase [Methylophaga sp. 42_8_T64]